MANPLVSVGVLNRLKGSVVWNDFSGLNVTASYLGREGIRLALEGEATTFINAMTSAVPSQEPYQLVSLTLHLLKTQSLSDQYKAQQESDAQLGDCTVRPDVSTGLTPYQLTNCSIQSVRELSFAGDDPVYAVTIKGTYNINAALWD